MSVMFLYVDQATSNIVNASYNTPADVPSGQMIEVVESTTPHALDALQNPQNYYWDNGVLPIPSISLAYANGVATVTVNNPKSGMTTAEVSVQVCGQQYAADMNGLTGTLNIAIHQALQGFTNSITASAPGCISSNAVDIGGTETPQVSMQSYLNGTDVHVSPEGAGSIDFLCSYWTSTVPPLFVLPDLATIVNMMADTLYGKILPALTTGTTPLVTLSADESNALADIQSSILPLIAVTLGNAAPKPAAGAAQTFDPNYKYLREHEGFATTAMKNFANDLNTIPNLQ